MIHSLSGRIADSEANQIVVEVGGVGFAVNVPLSLGNQSQIGDSTFLYTYLVVRETELSLYGFLTKEEREFFIMLLGVNGIGPRLALAILSTLNPNTIRRAVFNQQAEIFNNVSGVGKKTAQKILLHLQDKITMEEPFEAAAAMDDVDTEVMEALAALGYSLVEAQAALQMIPKDAPQEVEERLRIALSYFSTP